MKEAVSLEIVMAKLRSFIAEKDRYAVIHFAQFEKPFLKKMFGRPVEEESPFHPEAGTDSPA